MLTKERANAGRLWLPASLEIVLRNLMLVVQDRLKDLVDGDIRRAVELCWEVAQLWSLRSGEHFQCDFCDFLAPVLLSLVGTPHESLAVEVFKNTVTLMQGDAQQFDRVVEWVQQGHEPWRAIFWRDEPRIPPESGVADGAHKGCRWAQDE